MLPSVVLLCREPARQLVLLLWFASGEPDLLVVQPSLQAPQHDVVDHSAVAQLPAAHPRQEREQLLSFGLDEGTAGFVVTLNANLRDGAMAPTPGDLAHLIRRPTELLATTMKTWI